jgi:hypothetical protein
MSTTANPAELAVKAAQEVATAVYAPAFFDKLAGHGVHPANETERAQLLELAALLRENDWSPPTKTASTKGNAFLGHCLNELQTAARSQPATLKTAALHGVRQNPALKAAALELAKQAGRLPQPAA